MQNEIIGQIPGVIIGVFTALISVYLGHRLIRHQQPKLAEETLAFNKSLPDLKDVMEDIYLQFSLNHTLLIEPNIPRTLRLSKRHSHTPNGYFDFLIQNKTRKFVFKYWDSTDKRRTLKLTVDGNKMIAEVFMLPHEIKEVIRILKTTL